MKYGELLKRLQDMPKEKLEEEAVIYHEPSDSYHAVSPFTETEAGEIPDFLDTGDVFIAL